MDRKWWKESIVYQIYPSSFQDSDGDGIGDLNGIRSRLDYLKDLGVNVLWLCPIMDSPMDDNGYDISNYRAINPRFGTMEDFDALLAEAHQRGIRIVMDLVVNHTSDEHPWFIESRKSVDNPYRDYYIWKPGKDGHEPNNWGASFGGSAWKYDPQTDMYYLHLFSPKQPDLNWENPALRREIYDMILWWMEQGVEGFRLDVIDQIAKEPDRYITSNGPRLHEFLRELSRETFQKGCLVTVGEAWGADLQRAKQYSAPDGSELSMVFQFEQMVLDQQPGKEKWDLAPLPFVEMKDSFARWQQGLHGCGWNSLFLDNHDLPRIVSRWGDDGAYRVQSAKLLATMLHGMQGTPYIYQGEELGMTNVRLPIEDYRDVEIQNFYQKRMGEGYPQEEIMNPIYAKGRDNARTPMQWDNSPNAGFTAGTPWLKVNPNYTAINAQSQLADPDSVFHYYRRLIALRKQYPVFVEGDFTLLEAEHPRLFVYRRAWRGEELLVVCNFGGEATAWQLPQEWEDAQVLLSNYPRHPGDLRPWEAKILYRKRQVM